MENQPNFLNPNTPLVTAPAHRSVSHWLVAMLAIISIICFFMISYAYGLWPFGNLITPLATPMACTEEAKLCPDGSAVGRTGPNCEFAECPEKMDTSADSNNVVKIYHHGGKCATAMECNSTTIIKSDGKLLVDGKIMGTVNSTDLANLKQAIETADYTSIKANKFIGDCPTAYDGQEAVYTFYPEGFVQTIASCTVDIDNELPLFKLLEEIIIMTRLSDIPLELE